MGELALMARYIRIRSWTDLVLIAVVIAVVFLLDFGMKKLFPNLSARAKHWITMAVVVVIALVYVFVRY